MKEDHKIERGVSVGLPKSLRLFKRPVLTGEKAGFFGESGGQKKGGEASWSFIRGQLYRVSAELFDAKGNAISLGDQDSVPFRLEGHFDVVRSSQGAILVKRLKTFKVHFLLSALLCPKHPECLPRVLRASKEYRLVSAIRLLKPSLGPLLLPPSNQKVQLFALGGSGAYVWSSSDRRILEVYQGGLAVAQNAGTARAVVQDLTNPRNSAEIIVNVQSPAVFELAERHLEILPCQARTLMVSAGDARELFHPLRLGTPRPRRPRIKRTPDFPKSRFFRLKRPARPTARVD